ncbi:MAG: hypothetical protein NXI04_21590 [Planctomycetaceae bacterium]|nr:hypothetical protein [Planctomycetaceae bacterium]
MMQPHEDETDLSMLCRRRVPRVVMPVEVRLHSDTGSTLAMIRDASIDVDRPQAAIGVGLYHSEVLPLGVPIRCEVLSDSEELPAESRLVLMWTRNFDADGFLSGGRLEPTSSGGAGESLHSPEGEGS